MDENLIDLEEPKTQENKESQQDQNVSSSTEAPIESTEPAEVETESSDDLNDQEIHIEQSQVSEKMI